MLCREPAYVEFSGPFSVESASCGTRSGTENHLEGSSSEQGVPCSRKTNSLRNLIRIGLDRIGGFIAPDELSQAGSLVSTKIVSFDELEELASNDLTVLDVRGAAEFARRRIPEAINIAHTRLRAQHHEVPSQGPIYVHCQGGARAAVAAAFLERMGHEVLFIDDLFSNWQAAAGAPG